MNNTELKPCPFCGGKANIVADTSLGVANYRVVCTQCPTSVGRYWYWKQEDVIEAWNRRAE